jgi:hypothetical protein
MRGNGTWQRLADTYLRVSGRVLRGFVAQAAIYSLFLLLREIESRLDTFRTATWPGARRLPVRRLRQRDPGAEHGGNGNKMSHWTNPYVGTF